MTTTSRPDHDALAKALRRRVLEGPGKTDAALRQAVAMRAAEGPALDAPYDELARQIGEAAYRVTDEQVARIVTVTGGESAAFELIVAAALGAGLWRWQLGLDALQEATDETR